MGHDILQVKKDIIILLSEISRPGIDHVINYLNNSDFFSASCHSHHQFEGGLALHSLGVYKEIKKINPDIPDESIRIAALLHDLCSSHMRGYNHVGRGHHGLRSVLLIEKLGMKLERIEFKAICNHLHHVNWKKPGHPHNMESQLWYMVNKCDHIDASHYPGRRNR